MNLEEFKHLILEVSTESADIEIISQILRDYYINIPITTVELKVPFVARARINYNGEMFSKREHLSYNPNPDFIKMQRANSEGQQVFYAAVPNPGEDIGSCQNTALLETAMEYVRDYKISRQIITLSRWGLKRPLIVSVLPFYELSYKKNEDFRKANDEYRKLINEKLQGVSQEKKTEYISSLEFISEVFCKTENKQLYYKISSCYFNMIIEVTKYNNIHLDGLLYPSANTGAAGGNLALLKGAIDSNALEFDYAVMMAMHRHPSNPNDITFYPVSEGIAPDMHGNFNFSAVW